jgi:hypothetical protein
MNIFVFIILSFAFRVAATVGVVYEAVPPSLVE